MKRGRNNAVNKVTRKVRTNPPTMIKTIPNGCRKRLQRISLPFARRSRCSRLIVAATRVSCIDFPDLKKYKFHIQRYSRVVCSMDIYIYVLYKSMVCSFGQS